MSLPRQPLINDADILMGAHVSDDLSQVQPESFHPELLVQTAISKLEGLRVVLVHRTIGEFTVMPCIPGSDRFPKPVPIGKRGVGWLESSVNAWIDARVSASKSKGV